MGDGGPGEARFGGGPGRYAGGLLWAPGPVCRIVYTARKDEYLSGV